MRLSMAGIDFVATTTETHEACSLVGARLTDALRTIAAKDVSACAIVAAADRVELYVSHAAETAPDGAALLREALGVNDGSANDGYIKLSGRDAFDHLLRRACGADSDASDDNRILDQLRTAIEAARAAGTSDALLDDAFRTAVAAGERMRDEAENFEARWGDRRRRRTDQPGDTQACFPLFINICGATALLIGGGTVAARRAGVLLEFGARVRMVAPVLSDAAADLCGYGEVEWIRGPYSPEHLDGVALAVAATDDRDVNRRVGQDARSRGIPVSVADRREECGFYFPAVVRTEALTAGLVSNNGDHGLVKRAAARLRRDMIDFESGEQ